MRVFYTSPWIPREWIKAHELEPHGIWMDTELGLEAPPLTAGVCAYAQWALHLVKRRPDCAVIFSTHCDQMRRSFDLVSSDRRVFLFNLPATWQSESSFKMYRGELERLGRFVLGLGGQVPTVDSLWNLIVDSSRTRTRLRDNAAKYRARDYAAAIAQFHASGIETLRIPARPVSQGIPLAILGGPLPQSQWDIFDTIERFGGTVVLNGTEAGERSLLPSCVRDSKSPLDALARSYLNGCVDVFQRPNQPLYAWLKDRLAATAARGIILWAYVGCDLWRAEAQSLREEFGLPVLLLDADEAQQGGLRNVTRIQAFLELMQ